MACTCPPNRIYLFMNCFDGNVGSVNIIIGEDENIYWNSKRQKQKAFNIFKIKS